MTLIVSQYDVIEFNLLKGKYLNAQIPRLRVNV